jgi:hypothetical protein
MRRTAATLLTVTVTALLALLTATAPALAQEQSYRYWGYYTLDGTGWTFAQTGPSEALPADGSVEGWRFAVTGESSTRVPRATPDVDALCGDVEVPEGSKRVGVVLDFGTAEDAPDGQTPPAPRGACAVVPVEASGSDVLAAVAEVRVGDGGFVCGIDGYPESGCGDQVEGAAPSGDEQQVTLALPEQQTQADDRSWLLVAAGVLVVAALAALAGWVSRQRRAHQDPTG